MSNEESKSLWCYNYEKENSEIKKMVVGIKQGTSDSSREKNARIWVDKADKIVYQMFKSIFLFSFILFVNDINVISRCFSCSKSPVTSRRCWT